MTVHPLPTLTAIPYQQVWTQPIGSLLLITVSERTFVTRRVAPACWTRPLRVAADRAVAEARLYDAAVAEAMRDVQAADLLIVDYIDDDDLTVEAVHVPGDQHWHLPACGNIDEEDLLELVDAWADERHTAPSAHVIR